MNAIMFRLLVSLGALVIVTDQMPGQQKDSLMLAPSSADRATLVDDVIRQLALRFDVARPTDAPLKEFLNELHSRHGVNFRINDLAFKNSDPPLEEVGDVKVKVPIARNVRLDRLLMQALEPIQGIQMVRQGYLEITTFRDEMKEAGEINLDGGGVWRGYYESRGEPFVHVTLAGRSLTAILADLARQYGDQNIILAPQA